jgi:hypothetical protein
MAVHERQSNDPGPAARRPFAHPPWSALASAEVRRTRLESRIWLLLLNQEIDWELASSLFDMAEGWAASHRGWDHGTAVLRALEPGATMADLVVALLYERMSWDQLDSLPAPLAAGARPMELLSLDVHGLNCAGADLPVLTDDELRKRMATVQRLHQDGGGVSPWLKGYTTFLVAEARRRRGQ